MFIKFEHQVSPLKLTCAVVNCMPDPSSIRFLIAYSACVLFTFLSRCVRVWSSTPLGFFLVSSFFRALSALSIFSPFASTKFIWKSKASAKIKPFACFVDNKKVDTNDMLQMRRSNKALSLNQCAMCLENRKSVDYHFLHCPIALRLWQRLFDLLRLWQRLFDLPRLIGYLLEA